MESRYQQTCPKCETTIRVGDPIKPHFKMAGLKADGRPLFTRGQGYVHVKCPPKAKRRIDKATGEIL